MFKTLLPGIVLSMGISTVMAQSLRREAYSLSEPDIYDGYYTRKIPLNHAAKPEIKLSGAVYGKATESTVNTAFPADTGIRVSLSFERKKPYARVRIPAIRKAADGSIQRLQSLTLEIKEQELSEAAADKGRTMKTTAASSVLAAGTWHKIALPSGGMYKVDYAFLKRHLGVSTVSSAAIRLFGNGGRMLPEQNNTAVPDDLRENALEIHDGGDGNFNEGDYFLFYTPGPLDWTKDSTNQLFHHRTNLYADSSYYFLSLDNGTGLRMADAADPGAATTSVNTYNEHALQEKELLNLGQFGKTWWGTTFGFSGGLSSSQTFRFPVSYASDSIAFDYRLASAAVSAIPISGAAIVDVKLNGVPIGYHTDINSVSGAPDEDPGVPVAHSGKAVVSAGSSLDFNISYFKNTGEAKAYLDYIEVNYRRQLVLGSGEQLSFRDFRSVGAASVARYVIGSSDPLFRAWDVTDPQRPLKMNATLSGSNYSFSQEATQLHEFIASAGTYPSPVYSGKVANQDLHGLEQTDYVIIAHEDFINAAEKLAAFHRETSGLRVTVVPVGKIYNEFGSGAKDISALRNFLRMFYDRAGSDESQMPRYLLLFGQASYDYKNIVPNSARVVPTYETPESLSSYSGYCSDDFFTILDENEYMEDGDALMDIGVGRLPATDTMSANDMVAKIIRYKSRESFGPWRVNNIYAGDIEDGAGDHLMDADSMSKVITTANKVYTSVKIYLDNMNVISTPGGQRSPDANKAINDNIYKGSFLFNYNGHGNPNALSHKRILTQDDFSSWKNKNKLPIMLTATCSFGRFDNPAHQSSGEKLMIKKDGGAIALITTTQVVFAIQNREFASAYLATQFAKKGAGWHSFGEAFLMAKNNVIGTTGLNTRKFALVGDPALLPDFPRYHVTTDSVQESVDNELRPADSVKSLGTYVISGSVRDDAGNVMPQFNGKVYVSFFDKAQTMSVVTAKSKPAARKYIAQNSLIYKGIATVHEGQFRFSFIAPKDINYDFGKGKIVYYATDSVTDASGTDFSVTVGGFSEDFRQDNDAPVVRPFINDSLFRDGGITNPNAVLYAIITDESGINISGNGIGHDLTALLDGNVKMPYVLNDYYETAPNTYKRGYVTFPFSGLSKGKHNLLVKAWDVFNNSGEGSINFEVLDGGIIRMQNLYNYPNPFRDLTHFVFEHNRPGEALKATINIFNTTGSLIATLEKDFSPSNGKSEELVWDGTGNQGAKLPAGVYPYRVRIATASGHMDDLGFEKVVLLR